MRKWPCDRLPSVLEGGTKCAGFSRKPLRVLGRRTRLCRLTRHHGDRASWGSAEGRSSATWRFNMPWLTVSVNAPFPGLLKRPRGPEPPQYFVIIRRLPDVNIHVGLRWCSEPCCCVTLYTFQDYGLYKSLLLNSNRTVNRHDLSTC